MYAATNAVATDESELVDVAFSEEVHVVRMRGLPFGAVKQQIRDFFSGFNVLEHRVIFASDLVRPASSIA